MGEGGRHTRGARPTGGRGVADWRVGLAGQRDRIVEEGEARRRRPVGEGRRCTVAAGDGVVATTGVRRAVTVWQRMAAVATRWPDSEGGWWRQLGRVTPLARRGQRRSGVGDGDERTTRFRLRTETLGVTNLTPLNRISTLRFGGADEERCDRKVHIISYFKGEIPSTIVLITLLSGLSSFDPFSDDPDFLFCLTQNFSLKKLAFSRLILEKWCTTLPTIQSFTWCHLQTGLVIVVVRELRMRQIIIPYSTKIKSARSKHVFKNLIHPFCLTIYLRKEENKTRPSNLQLQLAKTAPHHRHSRRRTEPYFNLRNNLLLTPALALALVGEN
uniref:Uncharacterized protein n=1 Tax=Oryza brachyantha TaxID=4533 RepID=J3NDC1_ORYBR